MLKPRLPHLVNIDYLLPVLVISLCSIAAAFIIISALSQIPGISTGEAIIGALGLVALTSLLRIALERDDG